MKYSRIRTLADLSEQEKGQAYWESKYEHCTRNYWQLKKKREAKSVCIQNVEEDLRPLVVRKSFDGRQEIGSE